MGLPLKNMALALKNFVKIEASPLMNSIFFFSTPEEILNFCNLPLENSVVPQPGGGGGGADIKCNSPLTNDCTKCQLNLKPHVCYTVS